MTKSSQLIDNQDEKISQRFIEAREATGLSKAKFARAANLHHSQVSEIENGSRNVTAEILLKIEDAFDINWRFIAKGEGPVLKHTYEAESLHSHVNEPSYEIKNEISDMKKELERWREKFLEINDKYTALLEEVAGKQSSSNGSRSA